MTPAEPAYQVQIDGEGQTVFHALPQLPDPQWFDLIPGEAMSLGPAEVITAHVDRDIGTGVLSLRLDHRKGWNAALGEPRELGASHYLGRLRQALHLATRYGPNGSVQWVRVQIV